MEAQHQCIAHTAHNTQHMHTHSAHNTHSTCATHTTQAQQPRNTTHTNDMPTCHSTRTWHTWHQCRSHYNTARLWVAISGPPSAAVTAAAVTAAAVMHRCHPHICRRCRPRCPRTFSCAPTAAPWPGAAPQRHGEQLWQWGAAVAMGVGSTGGRLGCSCSGGRNQQKAAPDSGPAPAK